eukprot:CAMPEP_0115551050 /NCGR_PEP_ID=MMETSP0271-20121206/95535_1 /TAXON_ID=71861 /ORGANISM="Scrippsiella trochoidea, Strain CCMP3099" /LENGTH=63 /DNA_ID=CAMNT_0002984647 /DNA_START=166 /DNA_END=357 /DNA_ORIENTATION=-
MEARSNTSTRQVRGKSGRAALSFGSMRVRIADESTGAQKLGQPVPLSYLASDEKRGAPLMGEA